MKLKELAKRVIGKILGAFPSPLPQGVTEFNTWIDSFIEVYQPAMDRRSVTFGIAAMIMRLNPTEAYKSKRYFALCLHKGAAAQISGHMMAEVKREQAEEQAAQQAAEQQTKSEVVTSSHVDL